MPFPSETTDSIIDHLYYDKQSLFACSLTCRTWLPSSRYHLFSKVILHPKNIESFSEILENPSNNVALVVQHLTIGSSSNCQPDGSTKFMETLSELTAHLQMVKSLVLCGLNLDGHSHEILRQTLSNLCKVETLELAGVVVCGLKEAVDVTCAFPLLKTLSMGMFRYKGVRSRPSSPSTGYQLERRSFVIKDFNLDFLPTALMDWTIGQATMCHNIKFSGDICYKDEEGPWIRQFFASNGALIRRIEVNFSFILPRTSTTSESLYLHFVMIQKSANSFLLFC